MGLLDALKYEKPNGKEPPRDFGIAKFVREHFDEIKDARDKGYSWKQIAYAVNTRIYFPTKFLPKLIANEIRKETKRRETD